MTFHFPSLLAFFFYKFPANCKFFKMMAPPTLSDLIDQKVSVLVDPIRVIYDNSSNFMDTNRTFANASLCALSLHRSANCEGHQIKPSERCLPSTSNFLELQKVHLNRIGWDTRICFRWNCDGIGAGMAMRVENCWTGNERNPIELIDQKGCSREETMISSPIHRHFQQSAHSVGWLTVRLLNTDQIRLSCAIRLCHTCENECRMKIMQNCTWLLKRNEEEKRWEEKSKELEEMCQEERRRRQPTVPRNGEKRASGALIGGLTLLPISWALFNKLTNW